MENTNLKRSVSMGVWSLGILCSIVGCLAYVRTMFVVGDNDSSQEVMALTFALATPLAACILGLWKRLIAGAWLTFAGAYYVYGVLAQRNFMIDVRHFSNQLSVSKTVAGSLVIALPLFALGAFGIITDLLKWPPVWKTQQLEIHSSDE